MGAAALAVAVAGIVVVSSSSGEAPGAAGKTLETPPSAGGPAPEAVAALPQAGAPQVAPSGPAGPDGRRSPMVTAGLDGAGASGGGPGGAAREPAAGGPAKGSGAGEAPEKESAGTGEASAGKPGARGPREGGSAEPPGGTEPVKKAESVKKAEPVKKAESAGKGADGGTAEAAGRSKHTDAGAVAYFQRSRAAGRVKDIRLVGGYLRIYTDLPESADNSKQAIDLCETGLDYLAEEVGEDDPVVFVQAEFGENGNPVLANVLGPDDSTCRVTYPRPRR
ncbi:hypothetical protein [Planomonospora sp. ID82291]|uniref:hypothetical protein n=1 Tax=Planomonospora sp. ID82291 TaxID=2738136 RepID=UPI0018C3AEB9|nr:hypothetical protein [Planomonospora sp. ID82291]MBG0818081.1 hypothetical protein [Planomonospora sp. ID82291]